MTTATVEKTPKQIEMERYEAMPFVGYFKVLRGSHSENYAPDGTQKIYKRGDIVHSKYDLERHNAPGAKKFEKVSGPLAQPSSQEKKPAGGETTLDSMTLDELRKFAEAEGIEIAGLTKKQQIIDAIRASN